jgi:hypothetical protein
MSMREKQLEAYLYSALSLIEFLHGCLTEEVYEYAYPESTLDFMKDVEKFLPDRPEWCFHSKFKSGCPSCEFGAEMRKRFASVRDL